MTDKQLYVRAERLAINGWRLSIYQGMMGWDWSWKSPVGVITQGDISCISAKCALRVALENAPVKL